MGFFDPLGISTGKSFVLFLLFTFAITSGGLKSTNSNVTCSFIIKSGKSDVEIKKIREAELKHGRVAMLASLGILIGESPFHPFFDGKITGPAIYQFQQADSLLNPFWVFVVVSIGWVEGQNIITGWEKAPRAGEVVAGLNEDYVNG